MNPIEWNKLVGREALLTFCNHCGAKETERCVTTSGNVAATHNIRWHDARNRLKRDGRDV